MADFFKQLKAWIDTEYRQGHWRTFSDSFPAMLERLIARNQVSVVIPIYNGLASLTRLLDSIVKAKQAAQIVLVDDCSPDPEIQKYCARFAESRTDTIVLRNRQNLGFTASVNLGMRAANEHNDVILLNSDTLVSPGWLSKLAVSAYAFENVATTSPISNAEGVFSVPRGYYDNEIENGWTPDMYDRLLGMISYRPHERVPTTSGFCYYIRRSAIEKIGYFDNYLFNRGYGEDNDYSERANHAGLINIVNTSCFIFHERGAAFGEHKKHLKRINSQVLKALYPKHVPDTKKWLEETYLNELWKIFPKALASFGAAANPEEHPAFSGCRTLLHIKRDAQDTKAEWSNDLRSIVVVVDGKERVLLDLFGLTRIELKLSPAELESLIIQLGLRWQVDDIKCESAILTNELLDRLRSCRQQLSKER
ncbi:MAG: glycosyltransferase [Deltaproteobacteria bacterium]|nr:glycosyltransferase [Deltaproteobacteria bacterium]